MLSLRSSWRGLYQGLRIRTMCSGPVVAVRAIAHDASGTEKNRRVLVSHILVDKDDANTLNHVELKLQEGADFKQLAQQHSICQSKTAGGEMGWLERGMYFPEFEAAAFSVGVGELARATTAKGQHLIKVLDEKFVAPIHQMSPAELGQLLSDKEACQDAQLVDVREEWEEQTASVPGFRLFPLSQFQKWGPTITTELEPKRKTVVLCHHGVRSMQMSSFLAQQGFGDVHNVTGGIDAYSRAVDSNVPLY